MSYILELAKSTSPIIKNGRVFEPNYIPDTVIGRKKQQKEMWPTLSYLMTGQPAHHLLLTGLNGTGKTVMIKSILRDLETVASFKTIYLRGMRDPKPNAVMRDLSEAAGIDLSSKDESVASLIAKLDAHISSTDIPTIFVFDEIDFFFSKDMWAILNYIVREQRMATVIGTSNDLRVLDKIPDKKLASVFKPKEVVFPPYELEELRDILDARAAEALYADALDNTVVPLCAAFAVQHSQGDARHAIFLLSKAAEICFENQRKKVTEADVREAEVSLESEMFDSTKKVLTKRHKDILKLLIERPEMRRAELLEKYEHTSGETISTVWIAKEFRILEDLGLITRWSRGKGKGRGVSWMISLNDDVDKKRLSDFLESD